MHKRISRVAERVNRAADRFDYAGSKTAARAARRVARRIRMADSVSEAVQIEHVFFSALRPVMSGIPRADGYDGITVEEGELASNSSHTVASDYQSRAVQYVFGGDASQGGSTSDCSHFVADVMSQSGIDVGFVTTGDMPQSDNYLEVDADEARAGDVIVQNGHMGIYTGSDDGQGHPIGVQMGHHGPADGKWGPGGWFGPGDPRFFRPNP